MLIYLQLCLHFAFLPKQNIPQQALSISIHSGDMLSLQIEAAEGNAVQQPLHCSSTTLSLSETKKNKEITEITSIIQLIGSRASKFTKINEFHLPCSPVDIRRPRFLVSAA